MRRHAHTRLRFLLGTTLAQTPEQPTTQQRTAAPLQPTTQDLAAKSNESSTLAAPETGAAIGAGPQAATLAIPVCQRVDSAAAQPSTATIYHRAPASARERLWNAG